jgi:hypothetical protein
MKVRELHRHLSKLDPKLDVLCYCEGESILTEKRGFVLSDILAVNATNENLTRHINPLGTSFWLGGLAVDLHSL